MVAKSTAGPRGAQKTATKNTRPTVSKRRVERRSTLTMADLDVDEQRAFEEWKVQRERDAAAWDHKSKEELEQEFLEKLEKSRTKGTKKKKKSDDCADNDPCADRQPPINMEELAQRVYWRLMMEARIESDRVGWAN